MSIFNKKTPVIRETKAPFEYMDEGKLVKVEIGVRYKGRSIAELKTSKPESNYFSDLLYGTVVEFVEPDGKIVTATKELLEAMDLKNIRAVNKAIQEDQDPK